MRTIEEALKLLAKQDIDESEKVEYNYRGENFGVQYTLMFDFKYSRYSGYFSGKTTQIKSFKTPDEAMNFFLKEISANLNKYAQISLGYFNNGSYWSGENFTSFIRIENPEIKKYCDERYLNKSALYFGENIQLAIDEVRKDYIDKMMKHVSNK